jgi:hypothetical protein
MGQAPYPNIQKAPVQANNVTVTKILFFLRDSHLIRAIIVTITQLKENKMQDPADKKTLSLFAEQQKRRGRPPEGARSRTAAERKAEQRKRDRERVLATDIDREWTRKDCLLVLNDPSMSLEMQKMAVRQLNVLLNCDNHEN